MGIVHLLEKGANALIGHLASIPLTTYNRKVATQGTTRAFPQGTKRIAFATTASLSSSSSSFHRES
ncbi:hypothetical protein WN51_09117 [Melipona quadrifasciata]|uniref:Uncharacterized protein n=1 Tax=Melipona quadrifasciata TaxID=166423 RepID=A0A0M9A8C3_9HYME|nr:hypothetical protein WN51_09117 [Melipona quadrifasciata]